MWSIVSYYLVSRVDQIYLYFTNCNMNISSNFSWVLYLFSIFPPICPKLVLWLCSSPKQECLCCAAAIDISGMRGRGSLTVLGRQEFHYPHFSNFHHIFLFFLKLSSLLSSFWPSRWASRPPGKLRPLWDINSSSHTPISCRSSFQPVFEYVPCWHSISLLFVRKLKQ